MHWRLPESFSNLSVVSGRITWKFLAFGGYSPRSPRASGVFNRWMKIFPGQLRNSEVGTLYTAQEPAGDP